jgi:hypothetical protein
MVSRRRDVFVQTYFVAHNHVISCQHPVTFETLPYHCKLAGCQIGFLCHLVCHGIDSRNCPSHVPVESTHRSAAGRQTDQAFTFSRCTWPVRVSLSKGACRLGSHQRRSAPRSHQKNLSRMFVAEYATKRVGSAPLSVIAVIRQLTDALAWTVWVMRAKQNEPT